MQSKDDVSLCSQWYLLTIPQRLLRKLEGYLPTIQTMVRQTDILLDISRKLPAGRPELMGIFKLATVAAESGEVEIMLCIVTWQNWCNRYQYLSWLGRKSPWATLIQLVPISASISTLAHPHFTSKRLWVQSFCEHISLLSVHFLLFSC